jgi:phage terminase large subunit-like protein
VAPRTRRKPTPNPYLDVLQPSFPTNGPRVAWFVESYCTHAKGASFGAPLMMEPWQRWVLNEMFRVDPTTGLRYWRETCLMVPRGNAKSTLAAALGFYFLVFDGEGGPDVISSAWGEDQAREVFGAAKTMHDASPNLQAVSQKFIKAITCPANAGSWRIVSRIAETKQGSNTHALLNDEYHVHKSHELRDAFKRGMMKRRQPMLVDITTEGASKQTPLGNLQQGYYADADIEMVTPTLLVAKHHQSRSLMIRYGIPWEHQGDVDPEDLELVRACNPGSWLDPQRLIDEFLLGPGSIEADFLRYHMNMLVADEDQPIKPHEWDACQVDNVTIEDGTRTFSATDLGFTGDWSAHVLAGVAPVDGVERIVLSAKGWEPPKGDGEELHIRATVDTHAMAEAERLRMEQMVVDKWNARLLMQDWAERGLPVGMYSMEREFMAPASVAFVEAVRRKEIAHDGDPILREHVLNMRRRVLGDGWRFDKHPRNDEIMPNGTHHKTDIGLAAVAAVHLAKSGAINMVEEHGIF